MFLRIGVGVLAGLSWLGTHVPACGHEFAPPDILLIMPDQMRGDCLSILGHGAVRTPNFDQLARQGMLFRRAYCTVPSCIPARYALMNGLFPQTSGVVGFRQKPIDCPTLPQVLRDAGFQTVLVGRDMHQAADAAQLGYQVSVLGSTYVSDDDYAAALMAAVPEIQDVRQWVEGLGLSFNHWQAAPWPLKHDLHPTTWVIAQARRVLADAAHEQPLFLTASFYAPHPPLFPPHQYFEAYLRDEVPEPARGDWVDWDSLTPAGTEGGHRVLLTGDRLRRAQAGYFGLIEHFEHAPCYSQSQAFHLLTDGRRKFIWCPADGREHLFDLERDPREEYDLARDPVQNEVLREWRERLIARLATRPEGFSDGVRLISGRPYPPLNAGVPRAAGSAADAFRP